MINSNLKDADINNLSQLNSKLSWAEEKILELNSIIEFSNDAIIVEALDERIISWNKGAEELYGYSANEVNDHPISILVPPESYDEMPEIIEKIRQGSKIKNYETVRMGKDGKRVYVSLSISPIMDTTGKIAGIATIATDISRHKVLEEKLKKYSEHLEEELNKQMHELIQTENLAAIGVLVAGVAHEINNPLSYVKSNIMFLQEDLMELKKQFNKKGLTLTKFENIEEILTSIIVGINRMASFTLAIKRFARPDNGVKVYADLNQGIKDTLLILQNQLKHRIKITEDYGNLPNIYCNIAQLNQVFMNLILNSSQAMERGEIWIKTWKEDNTINITIKDNGKGMKKEILSKIFEPFFTTRKIGSGLGLSLSSQIIKQHNGDIIVESEEGKGTTMTIKLPIEV